MKNIMAWLVKTFAGSVVKKVINCIPAIVVEAEKAMADKKITADERKDLAMKAIDIVAGQFNVTISGMAKWGISFLIDKIAKKLPSKDIIIPDIVLKITKEW
jgi:hypothetical protein